MPSTNEEFLARLLEAFRSEAADNMSVITAGLITLEKTEDGSYDESTLESVFRATHSLKGAARAVALREIESLCQNMESVFSIVKRGLILSPESFDTLHSAVKSLEALLSGDTKVRISKINAALKEIGKQAETKESVDITASNLEVSSGTEVEQGSVSQIDKSIQSSLTSSWLENLFGDAGDPMTLELIKVFQDENQENLQYISSGLLSLEKSDNPKERDEILEKIYRATHTIKGAVRVVELHDIETLCQNLESVFAAVRAHNLLLTTESFDLLQTVVATLERMLNGETILLEDLNQRLKSLSQKDQQTKLDKDHSQGSRYSNRSEELRSEDIKSFEQKSSPDDKARVPIAGTVRVSSEKLETLFSKADDLTSARLASSQRIADLKSISLLFQSWRWNFTKVVTDIGFLQSKVAETKAPELEHLLEHLSWNGEFMRDLEFRIGALNRAASRDQYALDTAVSELIDEIRQMILVPIASLLDTYPRIVRDISREMGKIIDFKISGANIEIDRRILESIRDPLMHIIRNAIDHGIETPEVRESRGKPRSGTISICVSHTKAHEIEMRISDDGGGIDCDEIRSTAIERGITSSEEIAQVSDDEVIRLVFKSGLSTAQTITTVSGRGLGLAIALEKISQTQGTIQIQSSINSGTSFILTLPLTLATFRGIFISVDKRHFVIPMQSVERVIQIRQDDLKTIENRLIIEINGEPVPVVSLARVLGLPVKGGSGKDDDEIVFINVRSERFGILVDTIYGVREIVVKDLGRQIRRTQFISGATIMADGTIVPVLNVDDVIKAVKGGIDSIVERPETQEGFALRTLLVVEDSITSRMLLKNILEGAGYIVETAVDGVDALTKVKSTPIDLVVSDVDMPRMNGFVLTEKIRGDSKYGDLPVILVTSLDSREDREHGIAVGANAYIVKSSFDQSNLLDVIRRLI